MVDAGRKPWHSKTVISHVYDLLSPLQVGAGLSGVNWKWLSLWAVDCSCRCSSCPFLPVVLAFVFFFFFFFPPPSHLWTTGAADVNCCFASVSEKLWRDPNCCFQWQLGLTELWKEHATRNCSAELLRGALSGVEIGLARSCSIFFKAGLHLCSWKPPGRKNNILAKVYFCPSFF